MERVNTLHKQRYYRNYTYNNFDLVRFEVEYYESNLLICAKKNLKKHAQEWLIYFHQQVNGYLEKNPLFKASLCAVEIDESAPEIIIAMAKAGQKADLGPMAAVAGAIAEFVGKKLLSFSDEIIVENGGDIFIAVKKQRRIGIFAGAGNIYNRLAIKLSAFDTPCGICASSGKFGHSLSFGKADILVVLAKSTLVADAFATSIGNQISQVDDVSRVLDTVKSSKFIQGVIAVVGDKLTVYGNIELDILKPITFEDTI
ncbi:MAG: UPF0280 family protein [Candidatus Omnitrophota bacterium]|nr:MAG: UPF0280 family protein [Candidatus Omnitrophota bacterium]